jgi:hypothetical protein
LTTWGAIRFNEIVAYHQLKMKIVIGLEIWMWLIEFTDVLKMDKEADGLFCLKKVLK